MTNALLNLGSRSLAAAQGSLTTIAHNIANANTPGYSRQEAVLATSGSTFTGAGFFGRGVDLSTVRRQYDQFLTASVQMHASQASAHEARARALAQMDGVFAGGERGVGAAIDGLFSAAGDLANRPGDMASRQAFISRAGQLAQRLVSVGGELAELGRQADSQLAHAATQINARLSEIKALNTQIAQSQTATHAPNDLLDRRDQALQGLNGLMAVTSVASADGTLNLFTASGAALLVGNQQSQLKAAPDPANGSKSGLQLSIGPVTQWLDTATLGGGSLSGVLRFRDEDLAGALNQIGRLAVVMADRFNAQQAAGVDASGTPGGPIFSVPGAVSSPHSGNTGGASLAVAVVDSSLLKASDYRVDFDGTAYQFTRLADGQGTSSGSLPVSFDGLQFVASGAMAAGDSFVVQPFAAAAGGLAVRPLVPQQVATGYPATVQAGAANRGSVTASHFQVIDHSADTSLSVSITFNDPPTSFNVVGLAGGNLASVPYTPGQQVPQAPGSYNGWTMVLDGTPVAGDSFGVARTVSPGTDNRNALAWNALADRNVVDGATLNEAYAALLGDVGSRVLTARETASVSTQLQAQAVGRQQSVAGVNLDEEAANLMRFQQTYQASAKLIQASQALFDSLLSATGR